MKCRVCHATEDDAEFARHHVKPDGSIQYHPLCKPCYNKRAAEYYQANRDKLLERKRRAYTENPKKARVHQKRWRTENPRAKRSSELKTTYGITIDQYEMMAEAQNGKCAICGTEPNGDREKRKTLCVDHTGGKGKNATVRGLLCNPCNLGLGKFQDNIEWMEAAILYLKSFREV